MEGALPKKVSSQRSNRKRGVSIKGKLALNRAGVSERFSAFHEGGGKTDRDWEREETTRIWEGNRKEHRKR